MRIKKIEIENYRSLKKIELEFGDLTVLIGKNDAGKSNILKLLDLLFNREKSIDFDEISVRGGGSSDWRWETGIKDYRIFFNQKPTTIKTVAHFELNNDEIEDIFPNEEMTISDEIFDRSKMGNRVIVSSRLFKADTNNGEDIVFEIDSIKIGELYLLRNSGEDRGLILDEDGKYRYKGMDGDLYNIFLKKTVDKFILIPAVRSLKREVRGNEKPSPEGLAAPSYYFRLEKDISLNGEEIFEAINKDTIKHFPKYNKVASKEDGEGNVDVYFAGFPSSSVGDGIRHVFLDILNLYMHKNKILGIEEPEIHLHPEKQREVFNFLKEKSKDNQIIITTHSPIFVNTKDVTTYLVSMDNSSKETLIKPIEREEDFKDIKFEIGARNTDLFFYDCVVLIEGETEDRILPIISDAMGYDLAEKGIKLINIRGSGKTTKINEFLNYLKDSGIIVYIIADGHEDVSKKIGDWVREGLLKEENHTRWDEEIEDVFGFERVISAIKLVIDDFPLSVEDLKKRKEESGKPISKVLKQISYEEGFEFDKPTLGEKLGLLITDELNNNGNREESEVEKVIRKIVKLVE
ncbi:MAG: AAA family ATPase [Methanosarcinaceae archaeon]|nr:AAA family ATPase [Methanosarcinaceae archaeon]